MPTYGSQALPICLRILRCECTAMLSPSLCATFLLQHKITTENISHGRSTCKPGAKSTVLLKFQVLVFHAPPNLIYITHPITISLTTTTNTHSPIHPIRFTPLTPLSKPRPSQRRPRLGLGPLRLRRRLLLRKERSGTFPRRRRALARRHPRET